MNRNGSAPIIILVVVVAVLIGGGIWYYIANQTKTGISLSSTNSSPASSTPLATKLVACDSFPNNSIQNVGETERLSIILPRNSYLINDSGYNEQFRFVTASGTATALYISNGGPWGEDLHATPECWSTYFEFDGNGEVDLKVGSAVKDIPDYFVRFMVKGLPSSPQ